MKNIKNLKFLSGIFIKLLLVSFITSFIMFSSLFIYSASYSKNSLKNQVLFYTNLLNERTRQYLDLYLRNIDNVLLLIAQNEVLFDGNNEETIKILQQYKQLNSDIIGNLYIVFSDGRVVSNNQVFYEIIGNNQLKELYLEAFQNYGGINWSEPYYSTMLAENTVAFMKPVENDSGKVVGAVIMEINLPVMTSQLGDIISNENQTFIITSNSGKAISVHPYNKMIPFNMNAYPMQIKDDFLNKLKNTSNGINNLEYNDKKIIAIKSINTKLGWNLIILINENTFNSYTVELYKTYIRIGLLSAAILFITYFIISAGFSKPIRNLVYHMDTIKDGKFTPTYFYNRKDEIGKLYYSFNSMLARIQDLMIKQRETEEGKRRAEFKALHKQIRPHFLCNTLVCIKSLASQNRIIEVQESITDLIHLLQFIMGKNGENVTLIEELEFIKHYIYIQKMRYGDIFDFNEQIDDSCKKYVIPRLLIQPIIENSIFHGFSKLDRRGLITIHAIELDTTFHIFIDDNGLGMEDDVLKKLENSFDRQDVNGEENMQGKGFDQGKIHGISLINIQERIKLFYGEQYGMYIHSRTGEGTRIELCLPKNKA